MRCRKGNVDTHFMRMFGVGKGKDVDLGLCQGGSGTNERYRATSRGTKSWGPNGDPPRAKKKKKDIR